MPLPGIVLTLQQLAKARTNIDAAEQLLTAPSAAAADVVTAQYKIVDAQAALAKALIAVENSEDAGDPD